MLKKFFCLTLFALTVISLSGCDGSAKCQADNTNHTGHTQSFRCDRSPVEGSDFCRLHTCQSGETRCKNRNGTPVETHVSPWAVNTCPSCQ